MERCLLRGHGLTEQKVVYRNSEGLGVESCLPFVKLLCLLQYNCGLYTPDRRMQQETSLIRKSF